MNIQHIILALTVNLSLIAIAAEKEVTDFTPWTSKQYEAALANPLAFDARMQKVTVFSKIYTDPSILLKDYISYVAARIKQENSIKNLKNII